MALHPPASGHTITAIELCAGVGMLGLGAAAALRFLGHDLRIICHVEREAPAAAQLVALMEAGALTPAPIWSDLTTFDSAAWRGCVGGEQLPNYVEHHFSHPVHSTLDGRPLSPTARTLPRRLNPAFACWLMGWPIWWTNPALTSSAKSEMASYHSRLQQHLSNFFPALAITDERSAA